MKISTGGSLRWEAYAAYDMHANLRLPKIRTIQFLFDFGSKYQSCVNILRWSTFFTPKSLIWESELEMEFEANMVRILGHLRVFGLKKWVFANFCLNFLLWLYNFRFRIEQFYWNFWYQRLQNNREIIIHGDKQLCATNSVLDRIKFSPKLLTTSFYIVLLHVTIQPACK